MINQLVTKRPIALPVIRGYEWAEDYAVTGARGDIAYSLTSGGTKDILNNGIRLRTTSATGASLKPPITYKAVNFEAEVVARNAAGEQTLPLVFRVIDTNNRWYISTRRNTGVLELRRVVSGVYTTVATYSNIDITVFNRFGVRAVGNEIEVFLNGKSVIKTNDSANVSGFNFWFEVFDSVAGVAQGDWQYMFIRPLGGLL